ncbi:MAG: WD40 repeat domain-containing protein [Oleispira sp.]
MKTIFIKIIAILLLINPVVVFSSGIVNKSSAEPAGSVIKLNALLSGKNEGEIISLDSNVNRQFLSLSRKDLKVWDVSEQELIKSIKRSDRGYYVDAKFSNDGLNLYVLTEKLFSVYSLKDFTEIFSIPVGGGYKYYDFEITEDDSKLYTLSQNGLVSVYDLIQKEEITRFSVNTSKSIELSPNEKYIFGFKSYKGSIYQSQTGELVNTLEYERSLQNSFFVDNNNIASIQGGRKTNLGVTSYQTDYSSSNFKSLEKTSTMTMAKKVSSFKVIENLELSLVAFKGDENVRILDTKVQGKDAEIVTVANIAKKGIHLSSNARMLAVGTNEGHFKIYDTAEVFTSVSVLAETPKVEAAKVEMPKAATPSVMIVEAVTPEVIVPELVAPAQTLKIIASVTEGIAPLEVMFSIVSGYPEQVDSYYINLSGKESLSNGPPPMTLTKIFHKPGSFKVFVAIKDKAGKVVDSEVIIKTREQTFSDFKATYQ